MLKNKVNSIIILMVIMSCSALVIKIREDNFTRAVIKKSLSHKGYKCKISGLDKWWISNEKKSKKENCCSFKLLFEINFNCSMCLLELKEIYKLFRELSGIHEIELYLVTRERSSGFIQYYLEKELKNFSLWVIDKKSDYSKLKLILSDKSDRVIIAGDIVKYPFLKNEFKKQFKKAPRGSNCD